MTKRKPRSVMLSDEEYKRVMIQAEKLTASFSYFMRVLALELCEREQKKEQK